MGILAAIGGGLAAIVGILFGSYCHQQPQAAPTYITPTQNAQPTINTNTDIKPEFQQNGTNTNALDVGGFHSTTNLFVGCTLPQHDKTQPSTPRICINSSPSQSQISHSEHTIRSVASQEMPKHCEQTPPSLVRSYGMLSSVFCPIITISMVTITTGAYLLYKMKTMEEYLYKDRKLFNWNRTIATQDLKGMDPDIIGPVLASFVQQRYSIEKIMENYSPPVVRFLDKLDKEAKTLKQYVKAANVLKTLCINNLLGILNRHIMYAEDSLVRLDVMKKIIETWSAHMHTDIGLPVERIT